MFAYRLTNPYGPGQVAHHNQGVIPAFLQKIRNGEELTVYGDGTVLVILYMYAMPRK